MPGFDAHHPQVAVYPQLAPQDERVYNSAQPVDSQKAAGQNALDHAANLVGVGGYHKAGMLGAPATEGEQVAHGVDVDLIGQGRQ